METLLLRTERAFVRRDGDDSFLVRPAERSQLKLSPVAAAIVEELGSPATPADLCERLTAGFDVSAEECAEAVDSFVEELAAMGVVEKHEQPAGTNALRRRYLSLLKRALVNLIYPEDALRLQVARAGELGGDAREEVRLLRDIRYRRPDDYAAILRSKHNGDWTQWQAGLRPAHTMIGTAGLDNLERCAARVFVDGVEGDFLEAGVCHGGASIFLRALQVAHGEDHRRTWVADSFAGVPAPTHPVDQGLDLTEEAVPWMAASLEAVRDNFETYELLSDNVRFLPGLFADTLPASPVEQLAILRLDGDLYSSTWDTLSALYDRVTQGGFVIVDDYGLLTQCKQAVDEFLEERNLEVEIDQVDWTRVCWRKTE